MQSAGKMMQDWSPETIRFLRNAAEYGNYFPRLAAHLLPYLPHEGHVCDAGCGLGLLARALAPHCAHVTALDRSERAIDALRRSNIPTNLTPLCCDIFSHQGSYDAMIFCYFGRMYEIIPLARRLCSGTVVIVRRESPEHRFSLNPTARTPHTVELSNRWLEENNVPHIRQPLALEFGQPFRSLEEAVSFFRLYDKSNSGITPEAVLPRLQPAAREGYAYYLPETRRMELLVFQASDLPKGDCL